MGDVSSQPARPVAVLDPQDATRLVTQRVLDGLMLPSVAFARAAGLQAALLKGDSFAMFVLSLGGDARQSRCELSALRACMPPSTPLMLLMAASQVELAICLMDNVSSDFLLQPFSDDELRDRLSLLYVNHVPVEDQVAALRLACDDALLFRESVAASAVIDEVETVRVSVTEDEMGELT